ncbi:hypothetical protein FALBO_11086 [Fusarium albosuccineum]|uniref:ABM domain-containing protein n=1 Tax=Fusarium albosuccineum TaxID=1237068 RepID=A0A8H4PAE1_9HYPO|nr:hypothetical protein FALBO_11086 [Fusarium albosuccineum]
MAANQGISLHVTIHINPDDVDKFFTYFKPVYDKVTAEPECTFFEVYQSPEDPGTLHWVENWTQTVDWLLTVYSTSSFGTEHLTNQILQVQLSKEYYKEYLAVTEKMFTKPREFKVYNRFGPPYYTVK